MKRVYDSFAKMKRLQILFLFSNKLVKVNRRMFRSLFSKVKRLVTVRKRYDQNWFWIICVERLHLYSNKFSHVDTRTFAGLHSLQELWIQVNNAKRIDTIMSPFVHLKSIAIDNNDLETIDPNCFLTIIKLYRNESRLNVTLTRIATSKTVNLDKRFESSNTKRIFYINNTCKVRFNLKYNRMVELRQRMLLPNLVRGTLVGSRAQS